MVPVQGGVRVLLLMVKVSPENTDQADDRIECQGDLGWMLLHEMDKDAWKEGWVVDNNNSGKGSFETI